MLEPEAIGLNAGLLYILSYILKKKRFVEKNISSTKGVLAFLSQLVTIFYNKKVRWTENYCLKITKLCAIYQIPMQDSSIDDNLALIWII